MVGNWHRLRWAICGPTSCTSVVQTTKKLSGHKDWSNYIISILMTSRTGARTADESSTEVSALSPLERPNFMAWKVCTQVRVQYTAGLDWNHISGLAWRERCWQCFCIHCCSYVHRQGKNASRTSLAREWYLIWYRVHWNIGSVTYFWVTSTSAVQHHEASTPKVNFK